MADEVVLGIDPGRRWTAGVVRLGDEALYGWTVGPVDESGRLSPAAVDNVVDMAAFGRYLIRVMGEIQTSARHAPGGRIKLACKVITPPVGRITLAAWLIPRQVVAGVLGFAPDTMLIRPDGHGKRRPVTEHYPTALWPACGPRRNRPATWGPCEAPRGERDHERAAYDIAGVAAGLLEPRY
ncbi:hypothetical protein [Actinomadura oligospora]|uniref:hypothetical protein n=1 Tax=Actinomadura oligospora TaxID=111804 RepID=UPI0012FC5925|nr:hypothetical protein [Actinomadura oligospora]